MCITCIFSHKQLLMIGNKLLFALIYNIHTRGCEEFTFCENRVLFILRYFSSFVSSTQMKMTSHAVESLHFNFLNFKQFTIISVKWCYFHWYFVCLTFLFFLKKWRNVVAIMIKNVIESDKIYKSGKQIQILKYWELT